MRLDSTIVSLMAQPTYEQQTLDAAVDRLLASSLDWGTLRTARVLLKPNLITARNGLLACTDGRFIAAVARWFTAMGAAVVVGDSPAFGSAQSVLAAINALSPLQRLGVPVVEFRQVREIVLPCGHKAAMAAVVMDCDLLINLPRVKAHSQMRVTLAVKNLFGCLSGFHKPWWHMVHGGNNGRFAELLVDLLTVLPSCSTLVDGIVAMHQTGPVHGTPHPLGIIACGANPVAIDTGLLALLGVEPLRSPLWRAAHQAGLGGTDVMELVFPLATPAELAARNFVVPEVLGPVRFDPFRFVKNSMKRALLRTFGR
jgi:uncharacterized protein (DUF362 family)